MAAPNVDSYGVESAKIFNSQPAWPVPGQKFGAVVRRLADVYEASSESSGNKILVGVVSAGAEILNDTAILHDALGTSVTLALVVQSVIDGTETDVIAAKAASSAGTITPTINESGFVVTGDSYVLIEVGGAAATGTIKSEIRYAVQGG